MEEMEERSERASRMARGTQWRAGNLLRRHLELHFKREHPPYVNDEVPSNTHNIAAHNTPSTNTHKKPLIDLPEFLEVLPDALFMFLAVTLDALFMFLAITLDLLDVCSNAKSAGGLSAAEAGVAGIDSRLPHRAEENLEFVAPSSLVI
nr:hypothetical protein Iba_chr14aCG21260 [Ipomoea batatas]